MHHEELVGAPPRPPELMRLADTEQSDTPPPAPVIEEQAVRISLPEDLQAGDEYREALLARAIGQERTPENEAALAELLQTYVPLLRYRLSGSGRTPTQVDDLVQETIIKTWQNFSRFRGGLGELGAFMTTVGRNLTVDTYRKAAVRPREWVFGESGDLDAFVDYSKIAGNAAAEFVSDLCTRDVVDGVLDLLDRESPGKAALARLLLDGYTLTECAEVLGVPLGTLKSRSYNLRVLARKAFANLDDVPSPRRRKAAPVAVPVDQTPEPTPVERPSSQPAQELSPLSERLIGQIVVANANGSPDLRALGELVATLRPLVGKTLAAYGSPNQIGYDPDDYLQELFLRLSVEDIGPGYITAGPSRFERLVETIITQAVQAHETRSVASENANKRIVTADRLMPIRAHGEESDAAAVTLYGPKEPASEDEILPDEALRAKQAFHRIGAQKVLAFIDEPKNQPRRMRQWSESKPSELLKAYYFEGLDETACGDRFGITPRAVRSRISAYIAELHLAFKAEDFL
ncbi:MAG TPA: sigma factor [Candidatus Saccharimonadales bacterium]|nr:sigma factor [Candidatus Saccharimonadales bacterium]